MLPFAYPVILVFLAPVIAIEAVFLKVRLHSKWGPTIAAASKANLITMLLGFPLAWLIFLVVEMILYSALMFSGVEDHVRWTLNPHVSDFLIVVTSAAWMGPVEEKWAVPVAFVVLLVPSFLLSGYVESRLLDTKRWLQYGSARAVWQANLISYIFLAVSGSFALERFVARF